MNIVKKWFYTSSKSLKKLKDKVENLRERQESAEEKVVLKEPQKPSEIIEIHFSLANLAQATLLVLVLGMLIQFVGAKIGEVFLIVFISILLSAALSPTVDQMERLHIPRWLSILLIFTAGAGFLVLFVSQLIPLIADQILELTQTLTALLQDDPTKADVNYPQFLQPYVQELTQGLGRTVVLEELQNSLKTFAGQLKNLTENAFGVMLQVFNGVFNMVIVMVLTFFFVVDQQGLDSFFISLFPSKHTIYIVKRLDAIRDKVGYWLRGQLLMMLLMFLLSWVVYLVLGLNFSLTLAMLAGFGEMIPLAGAVMAGLPAILVGLNDSYLLGLFVFIAILVIQQIEGNIIYPLVMRRAVGLSPVVIILSMLIGFKTLGVIGAILAVPVSTSISIFVRDYTAKKSQT